MQQTRYLPADISLSQPIGSANYRLTETAFADEQIDDSLNRPPAIDNARMRIFFAIKQQCLVAVPPRLFL